MSRARHGEREAFAHLMSLPVNCPDRQSLRDRVPFSSKKLETLSRKFRTATNFDTAPKARWWDVTNAKPIYPAWTNRKAQAPTLPFESGKTVLPGLEQFAIENGILQSN